MVILSCCLFNQNLFLVSTTSIWKDQSVSFQLIALTHFAFRNQCLWAGMMPSRKAKFSNWLKSSSPFTVWSSYLPNAPPLWHIVRLLGSLGPLWGKHKKEDSRPQEAVFVRDGSNPSGGHILYKWRGGSHKHPGKKFAVESRISLIK